MEVGQFAWYLCNNRVHNATILAKCVIENTKNINPSTPEQQHTFAPFGPTKTEYATCHGVFTKVYASKDELLASL